MIKKVLLSIAIVLTVAAIYIARDIIIVISQFLVAHPLVMFVVMVAILMQLVGHILRVKRTKLVIDQAAASSAQFQFAALSTGYLFNALLPFRFGEVVRALLISRRLHVSFLYTFVAIIIERATDVIFLGILIVIGGFIIGSTPAWGMIIAALIAIAVSGIILFSLMLLKNENKQLIALVAWFAHFFNKSLANHIRFKAWSLIFGLQNFFSNKDLARSYIMYALGSWVCYIASALIVVLAFIEARDWLHLIVMSVSPYIISLNPLDASSYSQLVQLSPVPIQAVNLDMYAKVTWAVLVVPMAAIGLIALMFYRQGTRQTARSITADPYINKLMRHRDISQDFPAFLDSYFSGNDLAKILHKIEVSGELSLVRFFKGGSDAITVLVLAHGQLYVKKIIPPQYRDRLKAQYDWLREHKDMRYLVKVIDEQDTPDYYAIDLAYDPKNIPLFEFIHHNSLKQSEAILDRTWDALYNHLHKNAKTVAYKPKDRDAYIDKHILGCMEKAASVNEQLRRATEPDTITINGEVYDNFHQILDKIRHHKQAWRDIATYQQSAAVHGDPSVDNILVSTKDNQPFIIDPAPDGNIMNGPVFDMGKWMQSFYCGYEFLFRDEDLVELSEDGSVNYREYRSEKYMHICRYVQNNLAPKYLSEAEQKAIVFHGATLLIRRLKHQVSYNSDNTLKFYAVGVKTLNEFLRQYEK